MMAMSADEATAIAARVLYEEARALDEQRFEDWLAMYAEDAVYWIPAWTDEGRPTADPETELSLVHCTRRQLAERVGRVGGGRSQASSPLPRTAHIISNVMAEGDDERLRVRSIAVTHSFNIKRREATTAFALVQHELERDAERWLIVRKTLTLQNDYIRTMMDFYTV